MGILNPKRKDKQKTPTPPKWFVIMMVGFVVFAIVNSLFTDNVEQVQKSVKIAEAKQDAAFSFRALEPEKLGGSNLPMHIRDKGRGNGTEVSCWDVAQINYKLFRKDGSLIEEMPYSFHVGKGEAPLALERGVLGMQQGGRREITARPEMTLNADGEQPNPKLTNKDIVAYDVSLIEAKRPDNLPTSNLGLRIYTDRKGEGGMAKCTERVRIRLKGWGADGVPLWDFSGYALEPREVVIGQGRAPYAVEQALLGMSPGSKRMLIVPPGYGMPLNPEAKPKTLADLKAEDAPGAPAEAAPMPVVEEILWKDLPIPQKQIILLELELLPEDKTAAPQSAPPTAPTTAPATNAQP